MTDDDAGDPAGRSGADVDADVLVVLGNQARATFGPVAERLTSADDERQTLCSEFSVADLLGHLERSMVLLAGCAGPPTTDAGADHPTPARVAELADAALAAWAQRGFDGTVHLGSHPMPAADVHAIVLLELTVHAHDLAVALTGRPDPIAAEPPATLTDYLLERAPTLITSRARGRTFAAPVAIDDDAAPFDRLLAFTGRPPR